MSDGTIFLLTLSILIVGGPLGDETKKATRETISNNVRLRVKDSGVLSAIVINYLITKGRKRKQLIILRQTSDHNSVAQSMQT